MKLIFTSLFLSFLLFAPLVSKSQTGPGGVYNSSYVKLWLDANRLTGLNNNDPVSTWTDVSGNLNNATQTGTNRPLYKTASVGGRPSVDFDGVDDFMPLTSLLTSNTSYSFYVATCNAPNSNYQVLLRSSDFIDIGNNTAGTWGTYYKNFKNSLQTLGTTPKILTHGSVGTSVNLYTNGSLSNTVSKGTVGTYSPSYIGSNHNGISSVQNYGGKIAEIIYLDGVYLYDIHFDLIWNYLSSKYSIAIPNDYFAFDATHPNDVFGIGNNAGVKHQLSKGQGIVEVSNPTGLITNSYCLIGHDNASLVASTDVPTTWSNGKRVTRTWRVDNTNYTGNYKLKFDLAGISIGASSDYVLLIDNDGNFSNGGTTEHYTGMFFDAANNTVEFTGVSVPDGFYFTLGNNPAGIVSITTGDWHSASTWSCNCVPTSADDVTIKNAHTVSVTGGIASANNLIIQTGGTLSCNSKADNRSVRLNGDLTIQGAFNGAVNLHMQGTALQNINNTSGVNVQFQRLTINNSNNITINNGSFSLIDYLDDISGMLQNSGGSFTFVSSSARTSRINNVSGTGFSGKFILQRYVSSRADNWANLASPVQSTTIGDWDATPDKLTNEIYMSGVGGINGCAGNPCWRSVYKYNNVTQAYVAVTDTTTVISPGTGIELWFASNSSGLANTTFDSRGTPNFGNINVTGLSSTAAGEWNLIGNPYLSWVDWVAVKKTQLKNEVWIYDATLGNYKLYSGTQVPIPAHQSFKVESTGASPTTTFVEKAKLTNFGSTFYKEYNPLLTLNIVSGNGYSQETHFRYREWSSENYDAENDAKVLSTRNEKAPKLVSLSKDGIELSLNSINTYNTQIPLSIKNYELNKEIKLEVQNLGDFQYNCECILLKDKLTGINYDLKTTDEISFSSSETSIDNRFILSLSNNTGCKKLLNSQQNPLNGYVSSNQLNLEIISEESVSGNYELLIYDMVGKLVFAKQAVLLNNRVSINTPINNGIYTVTLVSDTEHYSFKLKF